MIIFHVPLGMIDKIPKYHLSYKSIIPIYFAKVSKFYKISFFVGLFFILCFFDLFFIILF